MNDDQWELRRTGRVQIPEEIINKLQILSPFCSCFAVYVQIHRPQNSNEHSCHHLFTINYVWPVSPFFHINLSLFVLFWQVKQSLKVVRIFSNNNIFYQTDFYLNSPMQWPACSKNIIMNVSVSYRDPQKTFITLIWCLWICLNLISLGPHSIMINQYTKSESVNPRPNYKRKMNNNQPKKRLETSTNRRTNTGLKKPCLHWCVPPVWETRSWGILRPLMCR